MKTLILKFILTHLTVIHKGTLLAKAKSSLALGFGISPFAFLFDKISVWTIENQSYLTFVFGAIIIDHLLGSIMHFIKSDFSWKKNIIGLITKVGLVVVIGFLFEGVNEIVKEDSMLKDYLMIVLRLAVFFYPAGSAFMNSSELTNGKFPPVSWINKIKKFQNNGNLKDLKNN